MSLAKRSLAEFIGTFWLVFGGCGTAILAYSAPGNGMSYIGVALAFGLTVLTMGYAIGHISGCHLNPAVTLGLLVSGRFKGGIESIVYIIVQVLGGMLAALALFAIAQPDLSSVGVGTFASNGWSETLNPNGLNAFGGKSIGMLPALLIETILACVFLLVILGSSDRRAHPALAPLAIGLSYTLIHLISLPVTNTSVNPARSTAMALITSGEPLNQLWLFWVAPIVGAVIAGMLYKYVFEEKPSSCQSYKKATYIELDLKKDDAKKTNCMSGHCSDACESKAGNCSDKNNNIDKKDDSCSDNDSQEECKKDDSCKKDIESEDKKEAKSKKNTKKKA